MVDYDHIRSLWYPETDVFVICFSVDDFYSFQRVRSHWMPEILHHMPHVPWLMVGMKTDLRPLEKNAAQRVENV